jgi:hypothetical protein
MGWAQNSRFCARYREVEPAPCFAVRRYPLAWEVWLVRRGGPAEGVASSRWWFRWGLIHCGEAALEIGQKRRGQLLELLQEIFEVRFGKRIGRWAAGLVGLGRVSQCVLKGLAKFVDRLPEHADFIARLAKLIEEFLRRRVPRSARRVGPLVDAARPAGEGDPADGGGSAAQAEDSNFNN